MSIAGINNYRYSNYQYNIAFQKPQSHMKELNGMDKAISNFKMENVSEAIDLSDF